MSRFIIKINNKNTYDIIDRKLGCSCQTGDLKELQKVLSGLVGEYKSSWTKLRETLIKVLWKK